MELTDLGNDNAIKQKLDNFKSSIDRMETILHQALQLKESQKLNTIDRVNHDLFIAYMLNTLHWCYLRSKGIDPNSKKVKEELLRVKDYMISAKEAIEWYTLRKTVDKPAAERFILHGLQQMRKHKNDPSNGSDSPPRKKINKE